MNCKCFHSRWRQNWKRFHFQNKYIAYCLKFQLQKPHLLKVLHIRQVNLLFFSNFCQSSFFENGFIKHMKAMCFTSAQIAFTVSEMSFSPVSGSHLPVNQYIHSVSLVTSTKLYAAFNISLIFTSRFPKRKLLKLPK